MGRFRHLITSLGNAGAVRNAGRLQVERRQEDFIVRRLERAVRVVEAGQAGAGERAA